MCLTSLEKKIFQHMAVVWIVRINGDLFSVTLEVKTANGWKLQGRRFWLHNESDYTMTVDPNLRSPDVLGLKAFTTVLARIFK